MEGKIIAVVGAPASGKSFVVKKLAEYFNADAFFEGEVETLPKRIVGNFSQKKRNFETVIWFRNQRVRDFLEAEKLKKKGKNVILDTFWITNQLHINSMLQGFEKELAEQIGRIDNEIMPRPDLIVFLQIDEKNIRDFIKQRGREFDQDEEFIQRILSVNKEHEDFFKKNNFKNILFIRRDEMDFRRESDFQKLIKKIKERISI
jgi:deoxyadenosine/deoxycytidine kinase